MRALGGRLECVSAGAELPVVDARVVAPTCMRLREALERLHVSTVRLPDAVSREETEEPPDRSPEVEILLGEQVRDALGRRREAIRDEHGQVGCVEAKVKLVWQVAKNDRRDEVHPTVFRDHTVFRALRAEVTADGFDAVQLAHPPGTVEGIREELRSPPARSVDLDADGAFHRSPGVWFPV